MTENRQKPLRKTGHFVRFARQGKNRTDFSVLLVRFSKKHVSKPYESRVMTGQIFCPVYVRRQLKKPDRQDKSLRFVRLSVLSGNEFFTTLSLAKNPIEVTI
jgi:hypothetical protein